MKKIFLAIGLLIILVGCKNQQVEENTEKISFEKENVNTVWDVVNEKTWYKDNNENFIFYTDNKNVKRCIKEISGFGVYTIARGFVDIEIIDNKKIKIENVIYELKDKDLVSENSTLTIISNEPIIMNRLCGPLDIEKVKSGDFVVENIDESCEK